MKYKYNIISNRERGKILRALNCYESFLSSSQHGNRFDRRIVQKMRELRIILLHSIDFIGRVYRIFSKLSKIEY